MKSKIYLSCLIVTLILFAGSCLFIYSQDDISRFIRGMDVYQRQEVRQLTERVWHLEDIKWGLESKLTEVDKNKAFTERSHEKQIKLIKESHVDIRETYENRVEDLSDEIKRLEKQFEIFQKELASESYGGWEGLDNFSDLRELYDFLAGEQSWLIDWEEEDFDCDDYTFTLMKHGAEQGKAVYPVILFTMQGYNILSAHTMNFVIVKRHVPNMGEVDFIVAIEPQTLGTTFIGRVDQKAEWIKKWYAFLP